MRETLISFIETIPILVSIFLLCSFFENTFDLTAWSPISRGVVSILFFLDVLIHGLGLVFDFNEKRTNKDANL